MARIVIDEERCKGCELCVSFCPKKILSLAERFNTQGYHPVEVIENDKCSGCMSCARICPDTVIEVYR